MILKKTIEEIKELISLKEEYWEYYQDTNCYAFALGLDVPENEIIKNAYQLGVIGAAVYEIPIQKLKKMSFEKRLVLDLQALKISYKEASPSDKTYSKFINNYISNYWIIALFQNQDDFHFLRKNYNDEWYHKRGYLASPIAYDDNKQIITDIIQCSIGNYRYVKTYQLHTCQKIHPLF